MVERITFRRRSLGLSLQTASRYSCSEDEQQKAAPHEVRTLQSRNRGPDRGDHLCIAGDRPARLAGRTSGRSAEECPTGSPRRRNADNARYALFQERRRLSVRPVAHRHPAALRQRGSVGRRGRSKTASRGTAALAGGNAEDLSGNAGGLIAGRRARQAVGRRSWTPRPLRRRRPGRHRRAGDAPSLPARLT